MTNEKIKVAIIGLGLIGSSILKGLSKFPLYEIYCVSSSSAKEALNFCKNASNDIKITKDCDIVFVCSEISKTLKTLNELNEFLSSKTIVVDVASIKKELLNQTFNFNFILTHPMAGTENSGFSAGFDGLFEDNKWLIEKENDILIKIIKDLKAKPVVVDMTRHDELCAQISHLPCILSFLLFDSATDESEKIASSGFRDTTRLALTDSKLALNMFKNEENILKSFDIIVKKMENLKKLTDEEKIKYFKNIKEKRSKMYDKNGKNIL